MKYWVFLVCLLVILIPQLALAQNSCVTWFTDASIENSTTLPAPQKPLPSAVGTYGKGVLLSSACGIDCPSINQARGTISFWIMPKWDGNDGKNHKILRIGDPAVNGLLIEKSSVGTFRFVMTGKNGTATKTTAIRTDVSHWKAGEWHHIQVSWINNGAPLGLALWIDRVCVVSNVFGGTSFMDLSAMSDKKVYIGDSTSKAIIDELIFRNTNGDTTIAYRDYFRTAPYTAIQITHKANRVNSDKRVLLGKQKHFGITATKVVNALTGETKTEYITNFDQRYGQWTEFDAKPYISWNISDTSKAVINAEGLVTGKQLTTTPVTLTAKFRGMEATYPLSVISWDDKSDLCLMFVERTPRYSFNEKKQWPDVGETVTSIAHIGNYGIVAGPKSFKVKYELIPDVNGNFLPDDPVKTSVTHTINVALAPEETITDSYSWSWPATPTFVRVTVDPDEAIDEICEANNERCELNIAKAFRWGLNAKMFKNDYDNRTINYVGSFSDYDWYNAELDRMAQMMRETILPTTSPVGIQDSMRVDYYHDETDLDPTREYYDGGFPHMEPQHCGHMYFDSAVGHEIGHTCMGLPDIYGQGMRVEGLFLKDENGNPYAGTPVYPDLRRGEAIFSAATSGYPDQLLMGYTPLMDCCHQWLENFCGGISHYRRQQRSFDFWGDCAKWIPETNTLKLFDVNDKALSNARIYIYQIINATDGPLSKYFPDRPKFIGSTDKSGLFTIPKTTCEYWDDWTTDVNDGAVPVSTPFAISDNTIAATHSYISGDILLLKIIGAGGQVEFQTLSLAEVNSAFFINNKSATYNIRTSLTSPSSVPAIVPPVVPDAVKAVNKRPVAHIKCEGKIYTNKSDIIIPVGKVRKTITLDASASFDPEGQPLKYIWKGNDHLPSSNISEYTIDTSRLELGEYQIGLYVIDDVRCSDTCNIKIRLVNLLSDAKQQPDGTTVTVNYKQITAMPGGGVPTGNIYIEEVDGSDAIRVDISGIEIFTAGLGDYVAVTGTILTTKDGERYITADKVTKVSVGRLMRPTNLTSLLDVSIPKDEGRFVGLSGKVETVGSDSFTLNNNGKSIDVYCGKLTKPAVGQDINVRGIFSSKDNSSSLLLRCPQDWNISTETNQPLPLAGQAQLRDWLLLGLFGPQKDQGVALDTDYISVATNGSLTEATIQPSIDDSVIGNNKWFNNDGECDYWNNGAEAINLNRYFNDNGDGGTTAYSTVYAHVYVWSPNKQDVDMFIRSDDGAKVFLNGEQVYKNNVARGCDTDEDKVRVALNAGWNRILFKVHNGDGGFGLGCRFTEPDTTNPVSGLAYQLNKP